MLYKKYIILKINFETKISNNKQIKIAFYAI